MRKTTWAALAAALIIGAGCGGGSSVDNEGASVENNGAADAGNTAKTAKPAKLGDTLTVSADGQRTRWTASKAETRTKGEFGLKPATGNVWVLVHVKAEHQEGRELTVWEGDLTLLTKTNRVYQPTFTSDFEGRPRFDAAATLAVGQNTDGWITYEVPRKELATLRLQLKQMAFFDDTVFGTWTLPDLTAKK